MTAPRVVVHARRGERSVKQASPKDGGFSSFKNRKDVPLPPSEQQKFEILKDEFLSNVSHEFRSPLSALKGYIDIFLKQSHRLSAKHQDYLSVMKQSVDRLGRFIDDVMDMAALDAGMIQLAPEWLELDALFVEGIDEWEELIQQYRLKVVRQLRPGLCVYADPLRLRQVLRHLLSNAIKYTPDGGKITLWAKEEGEKTLLLGVTDTGIGIPRSKWDRIFHKFEQVREDKHKVRKTTGTGLGLSLVQRLVQAQGGNVWVQGSSSRGTTIACTLPKPERPAVCVVTLRGQARRAA